MVAPTAFVFNDQAAQDNTFMNSAVNSFDPPSGGAGWWRVFVWCACCPPTCAECFGAATAASISLQARVTHRVLRGFAQQLAPSALPILFAAQPPLSVTKRVLREFAALHHELTEVAGVKVNLFQHRWGGVEPMGEVC